MSKADFEFPLISRTNMARPLPQAMPLQVNASACGKAIIVGEHAVVYGARAVAMPVPTMRMGVVLTPIPTTRGGKGQEPTIRVLLGGRSVSDHLRGVVSEAFTVLGIAPFSLELEGNSGILVSAGLGSSASLCVVVLRSIAMAAGLPLSRTQLAASANCLERRFHGNPSGLDTAVVACEEVISFVKGQDPECVPVVPAAAAEAEPGASRGFGHGAQRWRFALLDSATRSSTLAMIQVAAPYFQGAGGGRRLAAFDQMAYEVTAALGSGAADAPLRLAAAMNDAGGHLEAAGVVGEPLADLIAAARRAGALAAKPTGAGGGGCVLALLDPSRADSQLARLKEAIGATRVFGVELP